MCILPSVHNNFPQSIYLLFVSQFDTIIIADYLLNTAQTIQTLTVGAGLVAL